MHVLCASWAVFFQACSELEMIWNSCWVSKMWMRNNAKRQDFLYIITSTSITITVSAWHALKVGHFLHSTCSQDLWLPFMCQIQEKNLNHIIQGRAINGLLISRWFFSAFLKTNSQQNHNHNKATTFFLSLQIKGTPLLYSALTFPWKHRLTHHLAQLEPSWWNTGPSKKQWQVSIGEPVVKAMCWLAVCSSLLSAWLLSR